MQINNFWLDSFSQSAAKEWRKGRHVYNTRIVKLNFQTVFASEDVQIPLKSILRMYLTVQKGFVFVEF